MDAVLSKPLYSFADFRLDPERRLLLHQGENVALHPKSFDLLLALIENRDRILSKNELLDLVWENQFVEENNLAVQISTLRKIFGEKRDEHRFIVTIPGKGYRFIADVEEENGYKEKISDTSELNSDSAKLYESNVKRVEKNVIKTRSFSVPFLTVCIGVLFLIALTAKMFWKNSDRAEAKQTKLSRLTTNGKIGNAVLTSDGKFMVFVQKESDGESLWLKQLETGSQTRIAEPQKLEYVGLAVSPDDKFIYYSVFQNNQSNGWMRRISLIGGNVQEITGIETGVSVSFSPDGKYFAFTQSSSSQKETKLVVAETENPASNKILVRAEDETRKFATYQANPVAWSPDGNTIACSITEKNSNGMKTGILLVDPADGSEKFLLAPRFAWIDNLAWIDAENLAFVASENDEWSNQIWTVSKKSGEPRRLTNDLQKYQWLSAASGQLLTVQENSTANLKIADLDESLKTFKLREILREAGVDYVAFGADDAVYYVSRSSGKREIWRAGQSGEQSKQITSDAQISYGFTVANDDSIIFSSARDGGKHSLWQTDSSGGNFRRLTGGDDLAPQVSSDGRTIIFQRGLSEIPGVWKLTGENSEASPLFTKHSLKPALSPDGSLTAFYFMDFDDGGAWRIGLVSTATREFVRKLSFPVTINERRMAWHPSGKFLTFIYSAGEKLNLLFLPVDGGEPNIVEGIGEGVLNSFDWSNDGRRIVFSTSDSSTDAVLLNDFH